MLKLIPDWRSAWKYLSVRASVFWSALIATWVVLPKESQESLLNMLPFSLGGNGPALVVLIGFLSVLFARLKSQPGLDVKRGESNGDSYPAAHLAAEPADEWTTKLRQGLDRGYQPKPGQGKPLPPPGPLGGGGPGDAPK
jgi:hypothetical protein